MNFGANVRGGDRVIVRRRIEENKLASLQTAVQKNYHLGSIAKWEQSSSKLMSVKQQQRELIEAEKQKKLNLEIRKSKLRVLLAKEEEIYKKEIDNKIETPQERRLRLEAKAKKLREKRIKTKKEFVKQQKLKQFRNECDELRLNKGQNLTMECDRIRKIQIKEKLLKQEFEEKQDKKWLNVWQNELQKKIDRETHESQYKKKLNYDTANELKQQIKNLEIKRNSMNQQKLNQINERVQNLNKQNELAKLNEIQSKKELEMKRREMREQYEEYQKRRKMEQEYEAKIDKDFIQKVINRENEENLNKQQKQNDNAKDTQNYLSYLNELRQKEKENEELLDKLRSKELENEWIKKELKWKKEALARQQLLESVVNGRADQIAYKNIVKQKENQKNNLNTNKILKEIEEYHENERKKIDDKLKYNKEIQLFLKTQIDQKKQAEINDKNVSLKWNNDADDKEYKQLLKEETEKDKLALQQGVSTHHYPKTTANWKTF